MKRIGIMGSGATTGIEIAKETMVCTKDAILVIDSVRLPATSGKTFKIERVELMPDISYQDIKDGKTSRRERRKRERRFKR